MKISKRLVLVASFVCAALGVSILPAEAAAPTPACPYGYVCVYRAWGSVPDLIPSGQSRTYSGGVAVSAISNSTTLNYCVSGTLSFGLAPFTTTTYPQTIRGLAPSNYCLM
jgi:hypothetical protein